MPEMPPPIPADRGQVAWSRVAGYCDKLWDALQDLDEAGGVTRVAAFGQWQPKTQDKALATLTAARDALASEVARLEARRRHFPRRGRAG